MKKNVSKSKIGGCGGTACYGQWRVCLTLVCLLWLGVLVTRATDRYVSPDGTNDFANGYTNWAGAATNIQDAVSVATNGDMVLVTNGVYYFSTPKTNTFLDYQNQAGIPHTNAALVMITNKITVQSMNGPTNTIIDGYQYGTTISWPAQGVFLSYNATLNGFTVRNCNSQNAPDSWAYRAGGGIRVHQGGTISNCVITGCSASHGGGVFLYPSGAVYNCVMSNNVATSGGGGGLYLSYCSAGIVRDSIVSSNYGGNGGGIYIISSPNVPVTNCVATRNSGDVGIYVRGGGRVANCQIVSNIGTSGGGYYSLTEWGEGPIILNSIISYNTGYGIGFGDVFGGGVSTARNCLISSNSSYGIYMRNSVSNNHAVIDSCTIVKNNQGVVCQSGGWTNPFTASNCIIYSNAPADITLASATNTIFYNCCATNDLPAAQGNITNNPQFVDLANANYRLNANSPCVNRGTNQSWMTNAVDLDGRTRIRYGTVDMGAYEMIYDGTIYSVR